MELDRRMKSNVRQRGRSEWSLLIKDDHWKLSGTLEQNPPGTLLVQQPPIAAPRCPLKPILSRFNKEIDGKKSFIRPFLASANVLEHLQPLQLGQLSAKWHLKVFWWVELLLERLIHYSGPSSFLERVKRPGAFLEHFRAIRLDLNGILRASSTWLWLNPFACWSSTISFHSSWNVIFGAILDILCKWNVWHSRSEHVDSFYSRWTAEMESLNIPQVFQVAHTK